MLHRDRRAFSIRGRAARALPLASALAALLSGCTAPQEADFTPPASDDMESPAGASTPLPPPPGVADVCPDTRRVGKMLAPGSCPIAGGAWNTSSLFGADAPDPLSRYCLYRWDGSGAPDLSKIPTESGRLGTAWTDADCMAVTTSGNSDDAENLVRPSLRSSFNNAVERPSSLPVPDPQTGAYVRVAIIDTWADTTSLGTFSHGAGMGGIVQNLTCDLMPVPLSACPVHVVPRLALNMLDIATRDNKDGGYFGHQAHLAVAIHDAVADWQSTEPDAKLIINASIAWDPTYELNGAGTDRVPALAVRDAIDNAVCRGAVVIAAAGNSTFGPAPTTGLAYPAKWAQETVTCSPGVTRPRVWAVGGVDPKDRPLYNVRPGGLPTLVAPAELVYGNPTLTTGVAHAGPFTGASAAAAVVTSAAAAAWMYDRNLTDLDVMTLVGSTAVPLSIPATACTASGCGNAERVSICRAARVKAPGGAGAVPCATHDEGLGTLPTWTVAQGLTVDSYAVARYLGPALNTVLHTGSPCSTDIWVPNGTVTYAGPSPCPMEQYTNSVLQPIIGPQPGPDPCGACAIAASKTSDSWLQIAVSSELTSPVDLQVLSLSKAGTVVRRYDVGSLTFAGTPARGGLLPGSVYTLTVPTAGFTDFDGAVIEWVSQPDIQATSKAVVYTR